MIDFRERIEIKPGHSNYLILPLPLFNRSEIDFAREFSIQMYGINISTSVLHVNSDYDIDEYHIQSIDDVRAFPLYFKLFDYTTSIIHDRTTVCVNEAQVGKLIQFLKDFKSIDFYITYRIKDVMTKDNYTYFLKRFMKEKDVTNLHIINPYR